ncbi:hypothetical protein [Mesobacillus maritimus]|uniref:Uncharacterized protein n=1 Tax=Mesobacillus maritimus TaxID=1643336 RepID=A0ABS7K8K1_9BACI|nr:hypothetical protein [Mesobacillus maritimus]MBY0098592.1 hypothetical protein [Mesobacillus maritimus]
MKERFLWAGILMIVLSWLGNYAYFQSKQLDQPIFLDHFYEDILWEGKSFTFYYLTNKREPAEVTHVQIDGVEIVNVLNDGHGFGEWQNSSEDSFVQEYRHHYLKSVTLEFNKEYIQLNQTEPILSFETMEVFFNNQSSIIADVGIVNLYREDMQLHVLDSQVSSSNNQHRSEEALVTREAISIDEISIPFPEKLAGEVAVKVDFEQDRLKELESVRYGGEIPAWFDENLEWEWEAVPGVPIEENELFPVNLNENEWMHLSMYYNPDRTSYFEFGIHIKGKSASGHTFEQIAPIIDHPYLGQQDIDDIIAEKEGGQ